MEHQFFRIVKCTSYSDDGSTQTELTTANRCPYDFRRRMEGTRAGMRSRAAISTWERIHVSDRDGIRSGDCAPAPHCSSTATRAICTGPFRCARTTQAKWFADCVLSSAAFYSSGLFIHSSVWIFFCTRETILLAAAATTTTTAAVAAELGSLDQLTMFKPIPLLSLATHFYFMNNFYSFFFVNPK